MNLTRVVPLLGAASFGRSQWFVAAWIVACIFTDTITGSAALPVYNIVSLGFDDPEHTRDDGYKFSFAGQLTKAGQVSGLSYRYNGGSAELGQSAWLYDGATIVHIGLVDSEHTRIDDYKYSSAFGVNEAGQVRGYSDRYNGGFVGMGTSAWLYNGATTIDIGLTGSEHTRNDGYKVSHTANLNEAGQVRGYSERYNGSTYFGRSVWLYDGSTTIDVGLVGSEHTRNDGYKYSHSVRSNLNEAGQLSGHSYRFNGGSQDLGATAWLYDGATTIGIGLVDSEHTRNDGYKFSASFELNEAGQVSGFSTRHNGGSTNLGASTWFYDGVTTINVGLTGSEHTRNDGYKSSISNPSDNHLNEAGQIIGYSGRFNGGSADLGISAWLYDGATTINVGLTGSEHTRNDGYKNSSRIRLNEAGQVIGHSGRFNGGSADLGTSAWLYDGATTIDIGLIGPEHTRNDGFKSSGGHRLNEAGRVIGHSSRFNGGSADLGTSVWLYDGATTIDIGLVDSEHTRNDGYKSNSFSFIFPGPPMNEAGQAIGIAARYNGGNSELGQDAWFYDPVLNQTFALQLSTRSDGYAFSNVHYLGEDGLVVGTYQLFDELDNDLGPRAFYFTITDGLQDLGTLVEGGLAANGWDYLADAIRANGLGQIVGYGKLTSQTGGQLPYLLTPVPEPKSVLLAAAALLIGILNAAKRASHRKKVRG